MTEQLEPLDVDIASVLALQAEIEAAIKVSMRPFLGQALTAENAPGLRADLVEAIYCVCFPPVTVDLDQ
jgi:hypothetical protein